MKSKKSKIILSVCLAIVVAITGFTVPILAEEGSFAQSIKSLFASKASEQTQKQTYKNAYEKVMDEDGFIFGMDYDWFISNDFNGCSIGPNFILNQSCTFNERIVYTDMYNIKAMGYNTTNVWLIVSGQGLIFDQKTGMVTGIEPKFMENLERIFEIGREVGLYIIPSILPHGVGNRNYDTTAAGTPKEVYNKYFQFYWREEYLDAFLEKAVQPIAELISKYQDVIPITNLAIENGSNMIDDPEYGLFLNNGQQGTTRENYGKLLKGINKTVKAEAPAMMTSVEDMGDTYNGYKYNEWGIDLIGRNRYNADGTVADIENSFIVRPSYIGEFNTGETNFSEASQEYWSVIKAKFFPEAIENGYTGAFYYSYTTGGDSFNLFSGISTEYNTLRNFALTLSNQVNVLKTEYKVSKGLISQPEMDTPVLLCNKGSNEVYWIGGRGAQEFKIERSYDGGKTFTVLEEKISIDDVQPADLSNGLCRYTDNSIKADTKFCYRITAYNDEGKSAVSKVNNEEILFIPKDIMVDGSFENTDLANADKNAYGVWYNGSIAGVVSTAEARTGGKSFLIDKSLDGVGQVYGGTFQRVKVTPNTTYKLSWWNYKSSQYECAVKVLSEVENNGGTVLKELGAHWGLGNGKSDEDWYQCSITFTTGDYDTILVKMENGGREQNTNFVYFDDFELKEMR